MSGTIPSNAKTKSELNFTKREKSAISQDIKFDEKTGRPIYKWKGGGEAMRM